MSIHVSSLLDLCGTRQQVLKDAQCVDPELSQVAVHRWHQRGSVPPKYWQAIIEGAAKRAAGVTAEDFTLVHAGKLPTVLAEKGAA